MDKNVVQRKTWCASLAVVGCTVVLTSAVHAAPQTVRPAKDGTLADGGVYGPFDGFADNADWYFNESSYEGSITLSTSSPQSSLEHRVVWEYNLSSVTITPPVSATLNFTIRGAPVFPFPDVDVHVYAYPSDLNETLDDFYLTPATLQGIATVAPFQAPTDFQVDVSAAVSTALSTGTDQVAFRFQVDPATVATANQAFMDALDSDVESKPFLLIDEGPPIPGDVDGDGDVDVDDYLGFPPCMSGPLASYQAGCAEYDFNEDTHVDLSDYGLFQSYFISASAK